ncbi:hypothetical protein EJ110_NYTH58310 [Nymphaea thermarum]|nr:hypothetical protein EJ110_NYTH58310 [Nymphaea thermarum]
MVGSSQAIWVAYLHGAKLLEFNTTTLEVWLRNNISRHRFLVNNMILWSIFFCFACWHIWRWRN